MPGDFLQNDLSVFFNSSEFGEEQGTVLWNGVEIPGAIFDNEDIEVSLGEGVGEIIRQPIIMAPSSDFQGVARNDPIRVGQSLFIVKNFKDDGTGVITIYLENDNG